MEFLLSLPVLILIVVVVFGFKSFIVADKIGVNHWFLLSGILIIGIAIV